MRSGRVDEIGGDLAIAERHALAETERASLEVYRAKMHASMTPATQSECEQVVSGLLVRYPGQADRLSDMDFVISSYALAIRHFPIWAIRDGFQSITTDTGRNLAFMPSADELAAACERQIAPYRAQLAKVDRILSAKVIDSSAGRERARIVQEQRNATRPQAPPMDVDAVIRAAVDGEKTRAARARDSARPSALAETAAEIEAELGTEVANKFRAVHGIRA